MCVCICVCVCVLSCDTKDGSPPGSLSIEFSRQEYWSGLPFPAPGDLPKPGIEPLSPTSPALQADSLPTKPPIVHQLQFNF